MNRTLFIAATILISAFPVLCQAIIPFEVEKTEIKMISSVDGTPIHKEPSENSPVQLYKEDDDEVTYYWSESKFYPKSSVSLFYGPAVVLEENNGWYNIGTNDNEGREWVNGKYCTISPPTPITLNREMGFQKFDWKWIASNDTNKYALYFSTTSDDRSEGMIYLGKIKDGVLVCPYSIGNPSHPVKLKANNDINVDLYDSENNWVIEYGPSMSTEFGWTSYFDLSKLPNSMVDAIFNKMSPLQEPSTVYIGVYDTFEVFP